MKKLSLLILAVSAVTPLMALPGLNINRTAPANTLINARNRGVQQESQNNLKQIYVAITTYLLDNNDRLPASFSDITQYTAGGKIFVAHFDRESKAASSEIKPQNTSFAYVGNIGRLPRNGADVPLAFEKPWLLPASQRFVSVLTADGNVQRVQIPQLQKKSCKEIVEFLLKGKNLDGNLKKKLISNAAAEDKSRAAQQKISR
ncbi:MAG: hypothetical protein E7056_01380 [Lentisphaerae bacterium]|nr:hypothetical protein [Lentisphaerota bacterium]